MMATHNRRAARARSFAVPGKAEVDAHRFEANEIDLVLTDVVMPRMSGLELHDAIGSLAAPPPVVFMSGYSDAVLPEGSEVAPVLRKPFSEQDLLDHVRAAITLERKSGS